jgi:hypothetical protein
MKINIIKNKTRKDPCDCKECICDKNHIKKDKKIQNMIKISHNG